MNIPKRIPLSKSGRLLCHIMQRLILIASTDYVKNGKADPNDMNNIKKLTERIQSRLDKESQKKHQQCALFSNFNIKFRKPNRKRISQEVVVASSKREANKMIKAKYGHKTEITR
jgi:hypothetical protein